MHGFCFSEQGKEISIQVPDPNTDFFVFLMDYAEQNQMGSVAMTLEDFKNCRQGAKDIIRHGLSVIIVDPTYSPINDNEVLPVNVHRNIDTLDKHYPDAIVLGSLIPHFHRQRRLQKIKTHFQEGAGQYMMNVLTSGWVIRGTTGGADRVSTRSYEYVVERDYELENSNAKRKQPR